MSDEMNTNEEHKEEKREERAIEKEESKAVKYMLIVISVFLATFLAVYFVVDMNMHRLGLTPFTISFNQIEKLLDKEAGYVEKNSPAPVRIEVKDNKYVVSVNLKMFDNNPENIDVETDANGIKISGQMQKIKDGEVKESSFYQNVIFPNKLNEDKITQEKKGNRLIITIPFEKE